VKIAFNGVGSGWGNNGGTQSVFRMADALADEGVDVELWSNHPSKFTWFKPKAKLRTTSLQDAPWVDVLINTGCESTEPTYNYPRKNKGIQWLRGHETWAFSEDKLLSLYALDMPLWVNSERLAGLIRKTGRDPEIQYCGIPIDQFYNVEIEKEKDFLHVGALWSEKPMKRSNEIVEISQRTDMKDIKWWIFGSSRRPKGMPRGTTYYEQPHMSMKRMLYSACDVWIATTINDGLHIPPMEAALCGATVVANDIPSAGSMDYCIDGVTGLTFSNIDQAASGINKLRYDVDMRSGLNESMRKLIELKIGTVRQNAKKMIERINKL